jgi:hypothetical protein
MSVVYNVYTHPTQGAWGFSALNAHGLVSTAFIDPSTGLVSVKDLEPLKVAPAIQRLVRKGFTKVVHGKYLHVVARDGARFGEFVVKHPDLGEHLGVECVMFAGVPSETDMAVMASEWSSRLAEASGGDLGRRTWLEHVAAVSTYVPVFASGDAHAALLVAQWARENNLVLMANKGTLPIGAPQERRYEWRTFLREWFDPAGVDRAFAELDWPLAGALSVEPEAQASDKPNDAGLLAIAQQAAF